MFADTLSATYALPPLQGEPATETPDERMCQFTMIRERWVRRELLDLDIKKATGPDRLPSVILRKCARVIARYLAILIRKLLMHACWPEAWKLHWLVPLHKKKSTFDTANYRGVHLTPVISKVCERVIGRILQPFFTASDAFGRSQWAFQKQIGVADLIAEFILSILLNFQNGQKTGVYLSDVSGAFDNVDMDLLMAKLRASGLNTCLIAVFAAYLSPRKGIVLVEGECSKPMVLSDMVFQGTVLGPEIWNIFFKDVDRSCPEGIPRKFADDLAMGKSYGTDIPNA